MNIKDLIEHLQGYRPDEPVAAAIWLIGDVEARAEMLDLTLTDEQKATVLFEVHYGHDANYGISWDTLDHYIINMAEDEED